MLKLAEHLLGWFLAFLARVCSGARVFWAPGHPSARQRVYFFNHTSHADSLVIWSNLPEEIRGLIRPVAAEDYWTSSRLRRFVAERVFFAIFVSRDSSTGLQRQEQIDRILEGMGREYSLIFSPEGTRGDGREVQPFKSGLYHLCLARPELELVPVYLENLNRVLPKGEYLPLPLICRVTFGPPQRMLPKEPKGAFLARMRQALVDLSQLPA